MGWGVNRRAMVLVRIDKVDGAMGVVREENTASGSLEQGQHTLSAEASWRHTSKQV